MEKINQWFHGMASLLYNAHFVVCSLFLDATNTANMGKENFTDIYARACDELGVDCLTLKLSGFCDLFDEDKNYAGLILYHHKGRYKWKNTAGVARGYNCRGIYVLIRCTDDWPPSAFKRAGQGMVHDYLYEQMFGQTSTYQDQETCCGGFSILQGKLRYSSRWLNEQENRTGKLRWNSDGHKKLSSEERELVRWAVRIWKYYGPSTVVKIPEEMNERFLS